MLNFLGFEATIVEQSDQDILEAILVKLEGDEQTVLKDFLTSVAEANYLRGTEHEETLHAREVVDADDEGYTRGVAEGRGQGYDDGYRDGKLDGYDDGYETGFAAGGGN